MAKFGLQYNPFDGEESPSTFREFEAEDEDAAQKFLERHGSGHTLWRQVERPLETKKHERAPMHGATSC